MACCICGVARHGEREKYVGVGQVREGRVGLGEGPGGGAGRSVDMIGRRFVVHSALP